MMRLEATWLLYLVFHVQIGTKRHSEELIRALWVFIDKFGHLLVMIVMKYGITMNCFETLIKIEYSNIFFAALSFVGTEIGLVFATFVCKRFDNGCLLGVGVYREIELCLFAFFWLSLYADKKYVSNTANKLNNKKKIKLNQIDVEMIQGSIIFVVCIKRSCFVVYHIIQSWIYHFQMSQLYLSQFLETFCAMIFCVCVIFV